MIGADAETVPMLREAVQQVGEETDGGGLPQGSPVPVRRGMLGPDTPDEFGEFGGWRPSVRRSEIETFGDLDAEILLDGDGTPGGHGYHRYGLGIKQDEFPPGWGMAEVRDWVRAVIDTPVDAMPGRRDDAVSLLGVHRGVLGVLRLRRDGSVWRIATAHPYDRLRWDRDRDLLDRGPSR